MGDAVEFESLKTLWRDSNRAGWKDGQCVIGSVKSNVGHMLTAAGAAAMIKVLYALKEKSLPPTANYQQSPAELEMEKSPFTVLSSAKQWKRRNKKTSRKAAVSAFGFGGINAHVLLEEWIDQDKKPAPTKKSSPPPAIAIVGMDAHFGQWNSLRSFQERVLGGKSSELPQSTGRWWGARKSRWFNEKRLSHISFSGHFINKVSIPPDKFRIPPKELEEMLPQQLLMLQVATNAWRDAGLDYQGGVKAGVFIGLGLDLNTTNYHLRWILQNKGRRWNRRLNHDLSGQELDDWIQALRNASGPALTANRTMGGLGSVVASRISRELRLGGPSFSISSEETSGIHALRAAVNQLQSGTIDAALVGAVDLAGDLRYVLGAHGNRAFSASGNSQPFDVGAEGTSIGEGAAALTLKRLDDALSDGDRIYAIIKGIGFANSGAPDSPCPDISAYRSALEKAYSEAGSDPEKVGYIDAHGSGCPREDDMEAEALASFFQKPDSDKNRLFRSQGCALGSVKSDIGHTGAASGLASMIKACLCLYQEVIPGLRNIKNPRTCLQTPDCRLTIPHSSMHWIHNRADGPRCAAVSSFSIDGNCSHLVLEAIAPETQQAVTTSSTNLSIRRERLFPLGAPNEALFTVTGATVRQLISGLDNLQTFIEKRAHSLLNDINVIAAIWWQETGIDPSDGCDSVALVARTVPELLKQISFTRNMIANNPDKQIGGEAKVHEPFAIDRVFYNPNPLRSRDKDANKIAFVFPGSGNQFQNMGRDIFLQWPEVLRAQHIKNLRLRSQYQSDCFWNSEAWRDERLQETLNNHKAMILGQVALGTGVSDLLRSFGAPCEAVIGYSLGETAGFFSLDAWNDRDEMLKRIEESTLFTTDLAGEFNAARRTWKLQPKEAVDWVLGVIDRPMSTLKGAIKNYKNVYGLIANTLHECVVGGTRKAVEGLVEKLQCEYVPINGVTTAHCEIVKEVEEPYRELHLFDTVQPEGVKFFSGAWGEEYALTRESAADAILAHAVDGVDFPKTIEAAYSAGVRIFMEIGPGASCTRMINNILDQRPHMARSLCTAGQNAASLILRGLGNLIAERAQIDLMPLYGDDSVIAIHESPETTTIKESITVPVGGEPYNIPEPLHDRISVPKVEQIVSPLPDAAPTVEIPVQATAAADTLVGQIESTETSKAQAHQAFLKMSSDITKAMYENIALQMSLVGQGPPPAPTQNVTAKSAFTSPPRSLSREKCMEFATGSIAAVFGYEYSEADSYPTRVRLPDEPLMLVDRVISIEGEPRSLKKGRIITEHDVWPNSWYLDAGRSPTCIAVEAGQADLMLSGFLGIDFTSRGKAMYRLLDAEITFHRGLPQPGEVIRYDIRIERFFVHNGIHFFRFQFDGTVNNEPLLTMRNGCAGFFTNEDLAAGKGIVISKIDQAPAKGAIPDDWEDPVSMQEESYDRTKLDALRQGDLSRCFGPLFSGITLGESQRLPKGKMNLVHRVVNLSPRGGRFSLGLIRAEADINQDDWFLTCHFVDDKVMPGTLMYECCMHTLRIYLLRMGWITEGNEGAYDPVPGVTSRLKCRGQVLEQKKVVTYEVEIKELGYNPEPYAIADAKMFSDGKHIVDIEDMSIRFTGMTRELVEALWSGRKPDPIVKKPPVYDYDRVLAYAVGKPSVAFGDRYKIFDEDRIIARLPGPPFMFVDRITEVKGEPWIMKEGAVAKAQYDVPSDGWFFESNRQAVAPYSVLLESALQPCGWLAAYIGSALTSEIDLSFRNLGGDGVQYLALTPETGLLETCAKVTNVSRSAGMIIQEFDFTIHCVEGLLFKGTTTFGFFSKQALATQVGVQGAKPYKPTKAEIDRGESFDYPASAPFPDAKLRMIESIELFVPDGGPSGLGYIRGVKPVDPEEWFFKAHFHQDPVMPGSLGLEAFTQQQER